MAEPPKPVSREDSSDEDNGAPHDQQDDFGNYEEEVVPVAAKPFLFGPVDKWANPIQMKLLSNNKWWTLSWRQLSLATSSQLR